MDYKWSKQDCISFMEKAPDGRYWVKRLTATRSIPLNKYYWWVIIEILRNEFWETPEDMHDELKLLFLKDRTWKYPKVKDSKNLDNKEFKDYCNNIRVWASVEHWFNIPEPNEEI